MTATFNLAIVGSGEPSSEAWIEAAQALPDSGVELVAVAGPDGARAGEVAERFGVPDAFGRLEEAVVTTPIDGVIVASPPKEQADDTVSATELGLHVLCAAPFGRSAADARRMIRAARKGHRVLATGYRLKARAQWSLDFVNADEVGFPYLLEARFLRSVKAAGEGIPEDPDRWSSRKALGAGADLGAELLALGLPLLGLPPVAVSAQGYGYHGWRVHKSRFKAEDTLSLVVDCVNRARCLFTVAWGAHLPTDKIEFCLHGSDRLLQASFTGAGLDAEGSPPPTYVGRDGEEHLGERPPSPTEALGELLTGWVQDCRGQGSQVSSPDAAVLVHEVLAAAGESYRAGGKRIKL